MGKVSMSSVTLMILGKSLDPSLATKLLAIRPSQHWRCGDRKSFEKKDGTVRLFDSQHEWGGWKKWSSSTERKKEFTALLDHWCRKLAPRKKALARLRSTGSELFLDCCLIGDSSDFILPPALLTKLSELGISLRVTFYHHEEESNKTPQITRAFGPRV